ncbi:protein BIG GRAIN 1-like B [Camellia sinensis]|nr:protein BIG GRAIN 1-like B [Camellia sinensis]
MHKNIYMYREEMYSSQKSSREDRLKRNPRNPSFSSSLLDEIYRSIDGGNEKCQELKFYKDRVVKKQSHGSSVQDEDMASLRRACLLEKWMEKKVHDKVSGRRRQSVPESEERKLQHRNTDALFFSSSSSSSDSSSGALSISSSDTEFLGKSRTSCFTAKRPKPVKTNVSEKLGKAEYYEQSEYYLFDDYPHRKNHEDLKNEDGLIKSKLRALKIYSNLKKVKQPISPGGKLASFLNSLFSNGNSKKKNSSSSSTGGYEDVCVERKAKSTQASTCSSASSYSRSCLSKSSLNSKEKPNSGVKRTVTFYPVSVIVDEDCRPCGHKCIYENNSSKYGMEEVKRRQVLVEKSRKIEEAAAAREILKGYAKNAMVLSGNEVDYDDAASDSSSDLFELDHLAFIGNNNRRFCEELPVYETTFLDTNRAIASGLIR